MASKAPPRRRPAGGRARNRAPSTPSTPELPDGDVAVVLGKDEAGWRVVRRRAEGGEIEAGVLQPLREGKPIEGEVISLRPRRDVPFVFDVKTELADQRSRSEAPRPAGGDGPTQVATDAYRKGWDAIWGRHRHRPTQLN